MKITDLKDLDIDILLPLLRQSGIRSICFGDVSLTLGHLPTTKETYIEPSRFEDESKDDKLPCGHTIWEANAEGECLMGCLPQTKTEE